MGTALGDYLDLMNELLFRRAIEDLPEAVESTYVERLDLLWANLSEMEQQEVECELDRCPAAPPFHMEDVVVELGGTTFPRRTL